MPEELSSKELDNLQDSDFLISKVDISRKIQSYLKEVYIDLKKEVKNWSLDPQVINTSGKISTGEKYKDLPYFVLDYPRIFGEDTFSIRIVILWGRHIGTYFTLSGKYLDLIDISKLLEMDSPIFVSTSASPWEQLIDQSSYSLITDLDQEMIENMVKKNGFLKVAFKLDIKEIPDLKDRVLSHINQFTLFTYLS